jgi:uncharacterized membrane protein
MMTAMRVGRSVLVVLVVVTAVLVTAPAVSAARGCGPAFHLLPGLGGAVAEARGMNSAGVVVGTASTPSGDVRAVWWDRARRVHPIDTGSGLADTALDVDQSGAVVGIAEDLEAGLPRAWHRSARGQVRFLPAPPGAIASYAARINASGLVVGYVFFSDERFAGAIWTSPARQPRLLPVPHGFTQAVAFGVDDTGRITGAIGSSSGEFLPALWRHDQPMLLDRRPGIGYAMNNRGQVVGAVAVGDRDRPARWQRRGGAAVLAAAGVAYDIAHGGRTTGTIEDATGLPRAFVWGARGGVRLLPSLSAGATGYAVNDRATVAGSTDDGRGVIHAVLWTCA